MVNPAAAAVVLGLLGLTYKALRPPRPKFCGSPGGPQITSPRVKLSDGRHLAYREFGVPKEEARYKIIAVHGFASSKDLNLPVSQELIDELGIYFLFFDRAGYGESDPDPSRTVKSETYDIQELADKLQLGAKFYVLGVSMGSYPIWGCLRYIPHRLSGASLVVPFVSYWWSCFPRDLLRQAFKRLPPRDRWTFRVAHYAPWLLYWWMSQKWFPSLSFLTGNMSVFSPDDLDCLNSLSQQPGVGEEKITQQGEYESLHRDLIAGLGRWEFSPIEIRNPFPEKEGTVHIWQGYEDRVIPYTVNRYISQKLPWIHYHEIPAAGHFLIFRNIHCDAVVRDLLLS
ncbi:uncharacterized protein LOC129312736 [Prosopis cineraria]|uniref:uncharacterized protein LOC129312736 n=1 Tax=Prosopis cineraria TaxID=364024 RepID=UPI00240FB410|nr:uncharacterized protein LOC129312736 [Prosopis cineraria]XP_054811398.1 uncharacterized protein LOC129312736 [Prosopis cineraria]XP_054811399.1 uncharacterized protein LOC129312736 [Prosopis cineraria]